MPDATSLAAGVREAMLQEQAARFGASLTAFRSESARREKERSPELSIPATLTSIEIEFLDLFDASKYQSMYYGTFGLRLNRYAAFNTRGLFTVEDEAKFDRFLQQFRAFIACSNHAASSLPYNKLVKFVRSFQFHSAERISASRGPDEQDVVYLSLVSIADEGSGAAKTKFNAIKHRLLEFLAENDVSVAFNSFTNAYELKGATHEIVGAIARNFDVVHTIHSSSYGAIRESPFGLPTRDYPFTIAAPALDLPIIGIIDTGVSRHSPLAPLIVADDYSIAEADAAHDADGHGTSVAGFAALGHRLAGRVSGVLEADARILPIKILSGNRGYITQKDVGDLIIRAHQTLGVRIFVLAIGYVSHMRTDEAHSDYAYYLDQLAQQLDVLIVIATGNYNNFTLETSTYPAHYLDEDTNLCSPAESMNNLTVGSIGSNLEDNAPITASSFPLTDSTLPTAYTRKFHLDSNKWKLPNKRFFKPDVVYAGGNYARVPHQFLGEAIENVAATGLQCLSIVPGEYFYRAAGTSFSAPLVANLAARLLRKYPTLRLQTIKALIVNGAEKVKLDTYRQLLDPHQQRGIVGNGVPDPETCLSSADARVTVVIQRTIAVGTVQAMQIAVPAYLNQAHKSIGLLEVTATLCFAIRPVSNSPVAYCPVHMAFGVFRAIALEGSVAVAQVDGSFKTEPLGINGGKTETYKFKEGWSQDAYYKSKPLTNTQKTRFSISREDLCAENGQFKIAVECHFHKLLPRETTYALPTEYDYSLVLRFRENVPAAQQTQSLYDELQLCNDLEALGALNLDAEGDLELTIGR